MVRPRQPVEERSTCWGAPLVATTEPDVEVGALAEAPAVPAEVGGEVELRPLRLDAAAVEGRSLEPELHFPREHRLVAARAEPPRHGAEVPASADQQGGGKPPVQDPVAPLAPDVRHGLGEPRARPRAAEELGVELAPANAVADGLAVVHVHRAAADPPDPEARDRLERVARPVLVEAQSQPSDDLGRDPARAGLVPREGLPVQDEHVTPRGHEGRRAGRARWPAPDDQDVGAFQESPVPSA
jgi:hypothetical protein